MIAVPLANAETDQGKTMMTVGFDCVFESQATRHSEGGPVACLFRRFSGLCRNVKGRTQ